VSIPKEAVTVIPPNDYENIIRYEWICPQCHTKVHGDERKDSVFEIRPDPLCIYCRVKNGEFRLNGSNFIRVIKEKGKS
jgi:hypothetical protein